MAKQVEVQDLELMSIIGFDGNAMKGLRVHPDGNHILYPFGTKVAIQNIHTREYRYLEGHNNVISTIAVSKSGKYIASGQINHMGFKAPVIVWNYETGQQVFKHESHKVRVENVQLSIDENFVLSLGGRDDANIVVFDFETGIAICGTFSSNLNAGDAVTIGSMNKRNLCFLTGGVYTLKLWTLDSKNRSVTGADVIMRKIRRKITCIEVDSNDEYAWCGTSTGDIMKVKLNFTSDLNNPYPASVPMLINCFAKYPTRKTTPIKPVLWNVGVRTLLLMDNNNPNELLKMIVGAGDGIVEMVKQQPHIIGRLERSNSTNKLQNPTLPHFVPIKSFTTGSLITSLQYLIDKKHIVVATISCEIYFVDLCTFTPNLYLTCHTEAIYSLAFPSDYSEVFATASKNDVRVWSVPKSKELLRICVPNFTCAALIFAPDGKSIITGWNDGNIRGFSPQRGLLMYTILDAHNKGVTALAMTSDCQKLISAGVEGQVRVWNMAISAKPLLAVLKEHKGPVSSVDVSPDDTEAASASTDGTCIIWDIIKCVRLAILFSSSLFMCVRYHPSGCQIITTGTNRQIGYWEVFDGSLVREIEGSKSAALNTLDISKDGVYMVTGGNDQYVKVWLYKEGYPTHIGLGHGTIISNVKISADMKTLVSCSADGAIFIWKTPFKLDKGGEQIDGVAAATVDKEKLSEKSSTTSAKSHRSVEKIQKISSTQSVHSESRGSNKCDKKTQPKSPTTEGSVKCFCKGECKCENGIISKPELD